MEIILFVLWFWLHLIPVCYNCYSYRAAAYSKLNKHQQAIEDCNRALSIDPSYSKAYGRMG